MYLNRKKMIKEQNLHNQERKKEHTKQTYGLIKLAFLLILSFPNYFWQLKQKS